MTIPSQTYCCGGIYYSTTKEFTSSSIVEVQGSITGTPNGNYGAQVGGWSAVAYQTFWGMAGVESTTYYTLQTYDGSGHASYQISTASSYSSGTTLVASIAFTGSASVATNNYGSWTSESSNIPPFPLYPSASQGASGVSIFLQWMRVRVMPPSNTMPSVTFGTLGSPVTVQIKATLQEGIGSTQTISTGSSCGSSPTTFSGDGSTHDIVAFSSCSLVLVLPSGYVWEGTGQLTTTDNTCSTGTCSVVSISYVSYVRPDLRPKLVNLTQTGSTVKFAPYNYQYNVINGHSCDAPGCPAANNSTDRWFNGAFDTQLNIVITTDSSYFLQAVVSFNTTGTWSAQVKGISSSTFTCNDLVHPGDTYHWNVDTTNPGGTYYFSDLAFYLNSTSEKTWTSSTLFSCSDCIIWTSDVYAENLFSGWGTATNGRNPIDNGTYGNLYSMTGVFTYTGVTPFKLGCGSCGLTVTREYSNTVYTQLYGSGTSWNQTDFAGAFIDQYITGSSSGVTSGSSIVGPPDGNYATLSALSSGTTAYIEGSFVASNNGTVMIYGHSASGYSSYVQVQVSNTGTSWTTIYTGTWTSSTAQWIVVGSSYDFNYVKVTASYNSGNPSEILIDSVALFSGSFMESQASGGSGHSYGSTGTGSVTSPANIVGMNDSALTQLDAPSGSTAWVEGDLGSHYDGMLVIDGYSATTSSEVLVNVSTTGASGSYTNVWTGFWGSGTSPVWKTTVQVNDTEYIIVEVKYNSGQGITSDFYLDALFEA